MTDLAASLARKFAVPVIDGVACAVKLVEALAALGLRTSKLGGYAPPLPKSYSGLMAPFAPGAR
jgi:allantoin racemase